MNNSPLKNTSLETVVKNNADIDPNDKQKSFKKSMVFAILSLVSGILPMTICFLFFLFGGGTNQGLNMTFSFLAFPLFFGMGFCSVLTGVIAISILSKQGQKLIPQLILVIIGIVFVIFPTILPAVERINRENDPYYADISYGASCTANWVYLPDDEAYFVAKNAICSFNDYYNNYGYYPKNKSDIEPFFDKNLYMENGISEELIKSIDITIDSSQPSDRAKVNIVTSKNCSGDDDSNYISVWFRDKSENRKVCLNHKLQ